LKESVAHRAALRRPRQSDRNRTTTRNQRLEAAS
jgi:hypothetical protein